MPAATPAKPFPLLLTGALLGSLAMFLATYVLPNALLVGGLSVFLLAGGFLGQLVAVPVALYLLLRGDYRTKANIVITILAGAPFLLGVLAILSVLTGQVHL